MVSSYAQSCWESLTRGYLTARRSPLEKTPHKAGNGDLSITCRNRHCPKCQGAERAKWLESRKAELLPVEYFHVVFTLPEQMAEIAFYNKETVYNILFRATAETLLTIAGDPKHLGAGIGFFAILLTRGNAVLIGLSWIRPTSLLRLWSMGSELTSSSASALCGSRRRSFAGP
jgi:hypothetical protein